MQQRSEQRTPQRDRIVIRTARNRFDLDLAKKPRGVSYNWKAQTIVGQENTEGMVTAEMNGWTPVPADRHPEIMGRRATKEQVIRRGGLILMERPEEITRESRLIDQADAANQLSSQLQSLNLLGQRAAGGGLKRRYEPILDEADEGE